MIESIHVKRRAKAAGLALLTAWLVMAALAHSAAPGQTASARQAGIYFPPPGEALDPLAHNQMARDWIARCRSRNQRVLMAGFDEGRPEEDRRAWWSAYLGGGVWEAHIRPPYDRPLSTWEKTWVELGGARAFMESLPFQTMEPRNDLVKEGQAFCLAKPGEVYALYLPSGGSVIVSLAPGKTYDYAWWDPANGKNGQFRHSGKVSGDIHRLIAPGNGDWALRIIVRNAKIRTRLRLIEPHT